MKVALYCNWAAVVSKLNGLVVAPWSILGSLIHNWPDIILGRNATECSHKFAVWEALSKNLRRVA